VTSTVDRVAAFPADGGSVLVFKLVAYTSVRFSFSGDIADMQYGVSYLCSIWNQVPLSKRFQDIWLQIYRGHDLDLLGSRDVIGHVTI